MRSFLALLKKNGSVLVIGLLIGLACGFKLANAAYRRDQNAVINAAAAKAAAQLKDGGANSQAQVQEAIAKARANPQDFNAQLEAAGQYLEINRPDGALEFLQNAQKTNPTEPRALTGLAMAYLLMEKYDQSLVWARQALVRDADNRSAKFILMASLIETKQNLGEAERLLAELEKQRPGDQMLTEARQRLAAARGNATAGAANKSVLDHGPATPNTNK